MGLDRIVTSVTRTRRSLLPQIAKRCDALSDVDRRRTVLTRCSGMSMRRLS